MNVVVGRMISSVILLGLIAGMTFVGVPGASVGAVEELQIDEPEVEMVDGQELYLWNR